MALQSPPSSRPINYAALNEVLLLGGTALLLWFKWARGQLDFYIHPRYIPLILVSALILVLMAGVRLRGVFATRATGGSGWLYLLLALPLLLGTVVPAQPLGAGTLAGRGVEPATTVNVSSWQPALDEDSTNWNLLQWAVMLSTYGEADVRGKPVDLIGFVFHDEKLGADHFYVARYVITCCAADGVSVGMPVIWPGGTALPADDWVRVRGSLGSTTVVGGARPAIVATTVEPVTQPQNPYLYP